jgi:hypothetical protein
MEVEHAVRLNRAAAEALVPASVERAFTWLLPGTGRGTVARSAMVEGAACSALNPLHRLRRLPSPFRGGFELTR